jgi:hypothetical protein
MPPGAVSTLIKIAVASLLVGMALSFFGLDPLSVLEGLGETAKKIYEVILGFLRWAVEYVLIGAVVVVPIWLALFAWRRFRGKG